MKPRINFFVRSIISTELMGIDSPHTFSSDSDELESLGFAVIDRDENVIDLVDALRRSQLNSVN